MPIPRDVPKRLLADVKPATASQFGQSELLTFVQDVATAKLDLHGMDARNALLTIQKQARKVLAQNR